MKAGAAGLLFLAAALAPAGAWAQGFTTRDLSGFADGLAASLGEGFQNRAAPERVTLMCVACKGAPMIDVLMGRQIDGTEDRVRSGVTTYARMEELCRDKSPTCRLAALDVAPAVGWITTYPMGSSAGSTAVVMLKGDLLTVRSLSSDPAIAKRNAQAVVKALTPQLVKN